MSQVHYTTADGRYAVISSAAKMPTTCWGRYKHVAIVELDGERATPDAMESIMISERARAVRRVVEVDRRLNAGDMVRSAAQKSIDELTDRADELAAAAV